MKRYIIPTIICFLVSPFMGFTQTTKPYFQQEVNYTIYVKLNDVDHMLAAVERFEYINNSPDALPFLYIHLWPNAYKDEKSALAKQLARDGDFALFNADYKNTGFIDSLDFKVNGAKVKWEILESDPDICQLFFDTPLLPGSKVVISTPFRVKLPNGNISRMGHVGESYQITQWYPKPAVYDPDGWHPIPYLTQGEFYSEFGSFDVTINLPKNYVVGATGDLQTESERVFMDDLAAKGLNRPELDEKNEFPTSSAERKDIRFVQHNVHDFGWFADKRWMVLKGEVETPHDHNKVTTWAMFTPKNAELWSKSPEYMHEAIFYYSLWNGDYPYKQVSAVDGTISAGGGMEYPNITVIGNTSSGRMLDLVITHEIGHNWFYGMLGSNERDRAWMDEGINSFNEDRYMDARYPDATLKDAVKGMVSIPIGGLDEFPQKTMSDISYFISARKGLDQPLSCTSDDFTQINYGGGVYKKTAIILQYLRSYLGDDKFDKCMQEYFNEWHYKHPAPQDMQKVFEKETRENLSWFFDQLINTTDKIDFKLTTVKSDKDNIEVSVKNVGKVEGPFSIAQMNGKKVLSTTWYAPLKKGEKIELKIPKSSDLTSIAIDPQWNIPEIKRSNNTSRSKGLLKKVEPLSLKGFAFLENPRKTQLFYLPLVAWNDYNRWMIGINLHNKVIPQKNFEWSIAPMYSINTNNINGFASFIYRKNRVEVGVRGQKFNSEDFNSSVIGYRVGYELAEPYFQYNLRSRPENFNKGFRGFVKLSYQYLNFFKKTYFYLQDKGDSRSNAVRENINVNIHLSQKVGYGSRIQGKFMGSFSTNFTNGTYHESESLGNLLSSDIQFDWMYNKRKRSLLSLRAFYGYSLDDTKHRYVWNVAGTTGSFDYFYQQLYLGRNAFEGTLSRQVSTGQGMLLTPTTAAATKSLAAFNGTFNLPIKFPIAFYGGIAQTFTPYYTYSERRSVTYWAAGVSLPLMRNVIEVYLPVINSTNIQNEFKARDITFGKSIMFQLNLNALNPFEIIRNIGS